MSQGSPSQVAETVSDEVADMPEGSTTTTTDRHGNSLSPVFGAAPVNATSPTRPTTPIHDDPNPDFADLTPNTKALLEELVARPAPTNTLANTSLPSAKGGKGGAQYASCLPEHLGSLCGCNGTSAHVHAHPPRTCGLATLQLQTRSPVRS